jgi:hypothetical protein
MCSHNIPERDSGMPILMAVDVCCLHSEECTQETYTCRILLERGSCTRPATTASLHMITRGLFSIHCRSVYLHAAHAHTHARERECVPMSLRQFSAVSACGRWPRTSISRLHPGAVPHQSSSAFPPDLKQLDGYQDATRACYTQLYKAGQPWGCIVMVTSSRHSKPQTLLRFSRLPPPSATTMRVGQK